MQEKHSMFLSFSFVLVFFSLSFLLFLSLQENLAYDYDTASDDDSTEQCISNETKATTTGIEFDDDYDDDYKDGTKNIYNI